MNTTDTDEASRTERMAASIRAVVEDGMRGLREAEAARRAAEEEVRREWYVPRPWPERGQGLALTVPPASPWPDALAEVERAVADFRRGAVWNALLDRRASAVQAETDRDAAAADVKLLSDAVESDQQHGVDPSGSERALSQAEDALRRLSARVPVQARLAEEAKAHAQQALDDTVAGAVRRTLARNEVTQEEKQERAERAKGALLDAVAEVLACKATRQLLNNPATTERYRKL